MKKISLSIIAMFFQTLCVFAQNDSAGYKQRKLKVEEVNFVSSYYVQDGENSAVTGGIGTEKLTNFGNVLEVKMVKKDKLGRSRNIVTEVGFDHYTSASSDKVDPSTFSSASSADGRFYPSIAFSSTNLKGNRTMGGVASFSIESDYQSYGLGLTMAKVSKDKSSELTLRLQAYFDIWDVLLPIELRSVYGSGYQRPRNSYNAMLTYSKIVNERLQYAVTIDPAYQEGLLATKFQRVYFSDNTERAENLPDRRFKLPASIRAAYFLGDRTILRGSYRFFIDNWGVMAHTANIEVPVKITPLVSVSPFYRFYVQTAATYFAPYKMRSSTEEFYTSDYDLSAFSSHYFGAGLHFTPVKGIFGIKHFAMLELRYGHYLRSSGLFSDIISLNAKFR